MTRFHGRTPFTRGEQCSRTNRRDSDQLYRDQGYKKRAIGAPNEHEVMSIEVRQAAREAVERWNPVGAARTTRF